MTRDETAIAVRCERVGTGWQCAVTVGEDEAATTHEVTVGDEDRSRLAGDADVERLVEESFRFLLEREPREAILRRFELTVIGRYFPEYEAEIGRTR